MDFLRLQLNAAITRITQLDSEADDYEKKLQILMTRLRSYEERDNRVAYEQNFSHNDFRAPTSTPASSSPQSCPPPPPPTCPLYSTPSQQCSYSHKSQHLHCPCGPLPASCRPCCTSPPPPPPACCCSCRTSPRCLPKNTSSENSNEQLSEVNIRLQKLSDDMLKVKQSIFNLESSSKHGCLSSQVAGAPGVSLPSTATIEDPENATNKPADTDESLVSIEEFIHDEELVDTPNHLNSNLLTTQHSMLKHPSPLLISTPSPSSL